MSVYLDPVRFGRIGLVTFIWFQIQTWHFLVGGGAPTIRLALLFAKGPRYFANQCVEREFDWTNQSMHVWRIEIKIEIRSPQFLPASFLA